MDKLTPEEIENISNLIAEKVLKVMGAMSGERAGYNCVGLKFDCSKEYTCQKPDACEGEFTCPKTYTPAVRDISQESTSKDCNYVKYTCVKAFSCDDQYQCGLSFTCQDKFVG